MIPNPTSQARAIWSWCLASAFRTALACTIVGLATLYGPSSLLHEVAFPAFSYVTVILIITDATLGDTIQGCWLALFASIQSLAPAILSLRLIGPARFSCGTISVAVALAAFVVALPQGTHLVAKRIALGQIVIVYVIAFINGIQVDRAVMHPLHVAASTAIGVAACVLALLLPYPRLARWEVKQNCKLLAENVSERLKLFVEAFISAEDKALAFACVSQAKPMSIAATKLLQNIKRHQASMKWERLPWRVFTLHPMNPGDRFQEVEIPLRGMEMALTKISLHPGTKYLHEESKRGLLQLEEHISLSLKQSSNHYISSDCFSVPECNSETLIKSLNTLETIFPTNLQDLPSLFFLFCMKILHHKSFENPITSKKENEVPTPQPKQIGFFAIIWSNLATNLMSSRRVVPALKCSLSLGLAVLLGLIYSKDNGYWSGLPVAISLVTSREATFKIANVKAQGTVLGTIYGVLGCFLFEKFLSIRFLSLIPWFIVTNLLRRSKMYGQAGGISAVIGAVLILGRKSFGPPSEFAIARITETFIGLSCSIMVELLLKPTRASTLAKVQLSKCLGKLRTCIESISLGTNKTNLEEGRGRLKSDVSELVKFTGEAEVEPNFWFLPFPSASYGKLSGSLSKMVDLLLFSANALGFLEQESQKIGPSWKECVHMLDGDLEHFKEMVGSLIKCIEDVTLLKSLSFLDKQLDQNKNISCDIEPGKSPAQNIFWVPGSDHDNMESVIISYLQHSKEVVEGLHAQEEEIMKREMVLSLSALGFCMKNLIKEIREVEKGIHELVQWENPSYRINLYEVSCKIHASYK